MTDLLPDLIDAFRVVLAEAGGVEYDPSSDDSMVDFAEREMGTKLRGSPELLSIYVDLIQKMRRRETIRVAIVGPRGGGKTQIVASIVIAAWRFFGYDVSNVGGSLKQAQLCYQYVLNGYGQSDTIRDHFARPPTMAKSKSVRGREMFINAASDKSLRGPHPGGDDHGGMLTVDESAIVTDQMMKAALFQVSAANPSAVIQLSTMGEAESGYFSEIVSKCDHKGYDLRSFDAFDVASRCHYDCSTTCPVREHFAEDYYVGHGEARELVHKAFCAGKAHHTDGHLQIDEIARLFEDTDLDTFSREMMGVRSASVGRTFNSGFIDACVVDEVKLSDDPKQAGERFLLLEKAIGLDWGWAGMTAAVYVVRMRDTLVAYRWEMWDHVSFSKIRGHLISNAVEERIETIAPDAAEPSDNADLQEEADRATNDLVDGKSDEEEFGIRVTPVVFSQWKRRGYGATRKRFERTKLLLPKKFNGQPVEGLEKAVEYLKSHRRKAADGQPEKKDDHVSDALVCAVLAFERAFYEKGKLAR